MATLTCSAQNSQDFPEQPARYGHLPVDRCQTAFRPSGVCLPVKLHNRFLRADDAAPHRIPPPHADCPKAGGNLWSAAQSMQGCRHTRKKARDWLSQIATISGCSGLIDQMVSAWRHCWRIRGHQARPIMPNLTVFLLISISNSFSVSAIASSMMSRPSRHGAGR